MTPAPSFSGADIDLASNGEAALFSEMQDAYTHAELGIIETPFRNWATACMGLSDNEARRVLAWITVHNGGTEKAHFAHSCASLAHYVEGSGAVIDLQAAAETFREYFRLKGAVMAQLSETFSGAGVELSIVN
jgi:hypothetical protein